MWFIRLEAHDKAKPGYLSIQRRTFAYKLSATLLKRQNVLQHSCWSCDYWLYQITRIYLSSVKLGNYDVITGSADTYERHIILRHLNILHSFQWHKRKHNKTVAQLEIDGNPVRKCLCPSTHAPIDGRPKNNDSGPIYRMGRGVKTGYMIVNSDSLQNCSHMRVNRTSRYSCLKRPTVSEMTSSHLKSSEMALLFVSWRSLKVISNCSTLYKWSQKTFVH